MPHRTVIDYPPEKIREFYSYGYEYIDLHDFARKPETLLGDAEKARPYIEQARGMFDAMGREGDGDIEFGAPRRTAARRQMLRDAGLQAQRK